MGQPAKKDHAWKGTWNRPMEVDEDSLDPLTVARMTDHNVRGSDRTEQEPGKAPQAIKPADERHEHDDHGKLTPEEAERISSRDLPDST